MNRRKIDFPRSTTGGLDAGNLNYAMDIQKLPPAKLSVRL
jgi:hypothetical protein